MPGAYVKRSPIFLSEVARWSVDELVPLMRENFNALVTVAIAEATRSDVPSATRRLLRKREWHLGWIDALKFAEGELQVSTEMMTLVGDPRTDDNVQRLRYVRHRLHGANKIATDFRRRAHRTNLERNGYFDSDKAARGMLSKVYHAEYLKILSALTTGIEITTIPTDSPGFIEYGCKRGWLNIPQSTQVAELLAASDLTVRNTAAQDARDQQQRNAALRHPLLLQRWQEALKDLAEMTYVKAGAASPTALGCLPTSVALLSADDISSLIRARRFLAAIQQRQIECNYQIRWALQAINRRREEAPDTLAYKAAGEAASKELVARHLRDYDTTRQLLAPFEFRPGLLASDHAAVLPTVRQEILQFLIDNAGK